MKFIRSYILLLFIVFFSLSLFSQTKRARDYGIEIGVLKTATSFLEKFGASGLYRKAKKRNSQLGDLRRL